VAKPKNGHKKTPLGDCLPAESIDSRSKNLATSVSSANAIARSSAWIAVDPGGTYNASNVPVCGCGLQVAEDKRFLAFYGSA
jgi:hypothetical protein